MDENIGNSVGYKNWRNLPDPALKELAKINIIQAAASINAGKRINEHDE